MSDKLNQFLSEAIQGLLDAAEGVYAAHGRWSETPEWEALRSALITCGRYGVVSMRPGTWSLDSDTDPRWVKSGRICATIAEANQYMRTLIDSLVPELGAAPDDLMMRYIKD